MSAVKFTLLGLGSSDYSTFMGAPTYLYNTLTNHGAQFFYQFGKADEATNLEIGVEPWLKGLWDSIKLEISQSPIQAVEKAQAVDIENSCDLLVEGKIVDKVRIGSDGRRLL